MQLTERQTYLIYKKIENTLSPREEIEFENWMKASPEHREQFLLMKDQMDNAAQMNILPVPDKDGMWSAIAEQTILQPESPEKMSFSEWFGFQFDVSFQKTAVYATSVLLAVLLGYSAMQTIFNPFHTIIAHNGEQIQKELADGSTIHLDSGSRVIIRKSFGDQHRNLKLDGEAYFEVIKGSQPFVVATGCANVTVIGTKFNIRARDKRTSVFVLEGKVHVAGSGSDTSTVILERNQYCEIRDGSIVTSIVKVDSSEILGWRIGKLVFTRTPLPEVARALERYYDIKIKIADDDLNARSMTATFYKLSIEQAITSICESLNIDHEQKNKKYILKSKVNRHE